MYFGNLLCLLTFVYYICFAQIINICNEIFVQSFTHTVHSLIYMYRWLFVWNAIILVTLPSHHTAITPHCHHTILPSHHTAITSYFHQTTLPWNHSAIKASSYQTKLPSNHSVLNYYLTFHYLMTAARLLQAVTRFISGTASELCCFPYINRRRYFRSWTSPSVKISVFLHCHQDIWTLHNLNTRNHRTLYEQRNWKQITEKKGKSVPMHNIQTYMRRWCIYAFILHLSNSRFELNITKYNVSIC